MHRTLIIAMLLFVFSAETAFAERDVLRAEKVPIITRSIQQKLILGRREERRQKRIERRKAMLARRTERRAERLAQRLGRIPPESTTKRGVLEREAMESFTARKEVARLRAEQKEQKEERLSELKEEKEAKEKKLPNQLFTPVLPLPEIDAESNFVLLGEPAPVVGTVKLTPDDEPVEVRQVKITLTAAASSLSSLEVFDELGYVLGKASLDLDASANRNVFTLNLSPAKAYYINKDAEIIIAMRPRLKEKDSGGVSGQTIKVSRIEIIAIGAWSSNQNLVETSGPDFQEHVSALAEITSIKNAGKSIGTFSLGTNKRIGYFEFHAKSINHSDADPALESLSFSVSAPSEVTVTNPSLLGDDGASTSSCSVASSVITCSSIPANIGNLQSPRKISVYADVAVSGHENPFLQIELNTPGSPTSAGDITWTDGETSFTWVPLDGPIARGTSWE